MRDPHIIIAAYLEKHAPDNQYLALYMRRLPTGVWIAHVSDDATTHHGTTGASADEAMQRLAVACDPAQHREFPHAR